MTFTRIFLLSCCAALAAACVGKVKTDINRGVDIAALEPMAEYEVPVKAGFTTVVSLGGEQLAVTHSPLTISVPACAVKGTRADRLYAATTNFGEWLRTGNETLLLGNRVVANTFTPAIVRNGADGDLWDYKN